MSEFKRYLGDAVYVEIDEGMVKLSTGDGIRTTNTICMEVPVLDAFLEWLGDIRKAKLEEAEGQP